MKRQTGREVVDRGGGIIRLDPGAETAVVQRGHPAHEAIEHGAGLGQERGGLARGHLHVSYVGDGRNRVVAAPVDIFDLEPSLPDDLDFHGAIRSRLNGFKTGGGASRPDLGHVANLSPPSDQDNAEGRLRFAPVRQHRQVPALEDAQR